MFILILLAHVWKIRTRNSRSSVCKRCYSSTGMQHGYNGGLIRNKLLFRRHPFLHLSYCHPTLFTSAPAECIDQSTFPFRLQL